MTNVKVFVHATDTDADTRAMTLAPRLAKNSGSIPRNACDACET